MKLHLKRINAETGLFALHVDGVIAPGQYETIITSELNKVTDVTIKFRSIPGNVNTVQIVGDVDYQMDLTPVDVTDINTAHQKYMQNDEYFCPNCMKRWGVNEDEPTCD